MEKITLFSKQLKNLVRLGPLYCKEQKYFKCFKSISELAQLTDIRTKRAPELFNLSVS